ncbi:hypothetical protein DFAR_2400008 [Desulfarculales bacterium]
MIPQAWRPLLTLLEKSPLKLCSNNWVSGLQRSADGRPILAGDPHIDARILPGVWYLLGINLLGLRALGVNIAGLPGLALGCTGAEWLSA